MKPSYLMRVVDLEGSTLRRLTNEAVTIASKPRTTTDLNRKYECGVIPRLEVTNNGHNADKNKQQQTNITEEERQIRDNTNLRIASGGLKRLTWREGDENNSSKSVDTGNQATDKIHKQQQTNNTEPETRQQPPTKKLKDNKHKDYKKTKLTTTTNKITFRNTDIRYRQLKISSTGTCIKPVHNTNQDQDKTSSTSLHSTKFRTGSPSTKVYSKQDLKTGPETDTVKHCTELGTGSETSTDKYCTIPYKTSSDVYLDTSRVYSEQGLKTSQETGTDRYCTPPGNQSPKTSTSIGVHKLRTSPAQSPEPEICTQRSSTTNVHSEDKTCSTSPTQPPEPEICTLRTLTTNVHNEVKTCSTSPTPQADNHNDVHTSPIRTPPPPYHPSQVVYLHNKCVQNCTQLQTS